MVKSWMLPLPVLKKVALYGAVITVGSGFYFNYRIQTNFRQSDYYKQSLTLLRQNRGVRELLGEPISEGWLDLGNSTDNRADGLSARLLVPLKGPKSKAELYLWASRGATGHPWTVDRLELALARVKDKRLLVYDRTAPGDAAHAVTAIEPDTSPAAKAEVTLVGKPEKDAVMVAEVAGSESERVAQTHNSNRLAAVAAATTDQLTQQN